MSAKRGDAGATWFQFFSFTWVSSFVSLAWRRPLEEQDAYDLLPEESDAAQLARNWDAVWARFSASGVPSAALLNNTTRTLLVLWRKQIVAQFFWLSLEVGGR